MSENPKRLTDQIKQELISRYQVAERLVTIDWLVSEPPDLGEDYLVHIYFAGKASGITFHLQLKSVTNINERRYKRKKNNMRYRFAVKDLKHWETFGPPVVLLVWDIVLKEGRWILVDDAIKQLDTRKLNWRQARKKKDDELIELFWGNDTSISGLEKLRMEIGLRLYPIIAKNKVLSGTFSFTSPNTEEENLKLNNVFKYGGELIVPEENIESWKSEDWWEQWFRPSGLELKEIKISIHPPESTPIKISLIFYGKNGQSVEFDSIELLIVERTNEQIILSSRHQNDNITFNVILTFEEDAIVDHRFTFDITTLGQSITKAKKLVDLSQILSAGATLHIVYTSGTQIVRNIVKTRLLSTHAIDYVTKLSEIQNRAATPLFIPKEGFQDTDYKAIDEVFAIIINGGYYREHPELILRNIKRELLDELLTSEDSHVLQIEIHHQESSIKILGVSILLGKYTEHIVGSYVYSQDEIKRMIVAVDNAENVGLKLYNARVEYEYQNWLQ